MEPANSDSVELLASALRGRPPSNVESRVRQGLEGQRRPLFALLFLGAITVPLEGITLIGRHLLCAIRTFLATSDSEGPV